MTALEKARFWLSQDIDQETKEHIQYLIDHDPQELEEAFYKDLEFGTGGLRGIMGVGSNRMNKYTVGMATQGLANYLNQVFVNKNICVAVAHDSRNNSRSFAESTARVFAANNIKVHLFEDLRPTPELSYAIRELGCKAGVVITASHNPKEYNGYKAYWDDGAQLTPPHDQRVIEEVNKISGFDQIKSVDNSELIEIIGRDFDQKYMEAISSLVLNRDSITRGGDVEIVYSSIHGTGITMVPQTLKQMGFHNVHLVEAQAEPNGNFPTVIYPNPEEAEALALGLDLAKEIDADLLMATDPDADRVGVAIKNSEGNFILLNGNQMASLMVYYILKTRKQQGTLKKSQYVVKTIVTSELIDKMCATYSVPCYNTLTGFKYIATVIRELEGEMQFIGGGEESYGFMTSAIVRDKDAVAACALIGEMAAQAKASGSSLYAMLEEMYLKFGVWYEDMKSITIKGKAGQEEIKSMMKAFRANPPGYLGGSKVVKILDYQELIAYNTLNNSRTSLNYPVSNVLQFVTENGYKVSARPSGTEPKIKFYFSVSKQVKERENIINTQKSLSLLVDQIKRELNLPA
jgi:phosphoglucomutase